MINLAKSLTKHRLIILGLCLIPEVLELLVMTIVHFFRPVQVSDSLSLYALLLIIGLFVVFTFFNEQIWRHDRYRRLPLRTSQLVWATNLANIGAVICLLGSQVLILWGATMIDRHRNLRIDDLPGLNPVAVAVIGLLTIALSLLAGWGVISFIHLMTLTLKARLPLLKQLLVSALVSIMLAIFVLVFVQLLLKGYRILFLPKWRIGYLYHIGLVTIAPAGLGYQIVELLGVWLLTTLGITSLLHRYVETSVVA